MVRSVSFDLLANDKASDALKSVAKEVTKLADEIQGADGEIEITADSAEAMRKLADIDSSLAKLNAKSFRIDAEIGQAQRNIQILEAEAKRTTDPVRKVKIDGDIEGFRAQIRRLEAEKVSIDIDTAKAQSSLVALRASMNDVGNESENSRGRVGRFMEGMENLGSTFDTVTQVAEVFGAALQRSINNGMSEAVARVSLGEAAFKKLTDAAASNANLMGVTQAEYIKTAGQVAVLANNLGFSADVAADFGNRLPKVADNLAMLSAGSLSGAEASDVLRSALAGEYDPLQAVGIAINAEIVAQEKANILKSDATGLTDLQAGALATMAIVQRQTAIAADVQASAQGQANQQIEVAKARIGEMTDSLVSGLLPAIGDWAEKVNTATDSMKSNTESFGQTLYDVYAAFNPIAANWIQSLKDGDQAQFATGEAADSMASELDKAAAAADKEALALDKATQAAQKHTQHIIGAANSAIAYEASLDSATESLEKNGRTLDIHTEKGRSNMKALLDVASAANSQADAIRTTGGSMEAVKLAFDNGTADLIKLARAMGMSKDEATELAARMIAIPEEVVVGVKTPGAAESIDLTKRLAQGINQLPPEKMSKITTPHVPGATTEVRGLIAAIEALRDKTVHVTTITANIREDRVVTRAKGGWVPGVPSRVDTVPLMAAGGEYVVNSEAAGRWAPVLEAINSGRAMTGGSFGSSRGAVSTAGGGNTTNQVYITNAVFGNEAEIDRIVTDSLERIASRGG